MKCAKCGSDINPNDNFCMSCGEPVKKDNVNQENVSEGSLEVSSNPVSNDVVSNDIMLSPNSDSLGSGETPINSEMASAESVKTDSEPVIVQSSTVVTNESVNLNNNVISQSGNSSSENTKSYAERNSYKPLIITLCVGGISFIIFIVMIIIVAVGAVNNLANGDSLKCESDSGRVNLGFSGNQMITYSAFNYDFDFDTEKARANKIGKDAYIEEFNKSFVSNTVNGHCTYKDKPLSTGGSVSKTVTVGDSYYGYVDIPSDWSKFYDVDGNSSLQYSYAGVFILSMDVVNNSLLDAKTAATNFYNSMSTSNDITGLTAATVKVGKYEAYQVYMFYPSENLFLITYWFMADDGAIHYLALEGPEEVSGAKISDFLSIPESFRLLDEKKIAY